MPPRWRKVFRDLTAHKVRTLLVTLSIAVGIFAAAVMLGGRAVLLRSLETSFPASDPSGITFYTMPFDNLLVKAVERHADVVAAEGRHQAQLKFRLAGEREWRNVSLTAIEDFDHVKVGKLDRDPNTPWPKRGEVLIERASREFIGAQPGDEIEVKSSGDKTVRLRVIGFVHDLNAMTPLMSISGVAYVGYDSLNALGEAPYSNDLQVAVSPRLRTESDVSRLAAALRDDVIEQHGVKVLSTLPHKPGKHYLGDIFKGVSLLLVAVGVLTLLLSGFLVVNTVSSLVTQQLRQIGVMKAVGARPRQLVGMYFAMVLLYGILGVVLAIPLGAWAQNAFVDYGSSKLNFLIRDYSTPMPILALEIGVGIFVPLVAAAVPVLSGMRISVRQALYDSNNIAGAEFGHGIIDRILGSLKGLPRPIALSLRNTFLRKGRLALTLITLTLAAGVFMAVASVNTSIDATVNRVAAHRPYDLWVNLQDSKPRALLERETLAVRGVTGAETWQERAATRQRPDGTESTMIDVVGQPPSSDFFSPELLDGRWLRPDDTNAIVMDTGMTRAEPDLKVGGTIRLKIGEVEKDWRIVGLIRGDFMGASARVSRDYLDKVLNTRGAGKTIVVRTGVHDTAGTKAVADQVSDHLEKKGLKVTETETVRHLMDTIAGSLSILVVFLVIMAALLAAVGGIGLSGTMSINVMESTREIGVMRAIGASNGSLYQVFITEGVVVGLISWFLGALIAIPLAMGLTAALQAAISFPLTFAFSPGGVLAWLVFVIVISVWASLLPAYRAARVSVAEAIAYE
ncbi:MAG TPA: ABC transporter permease [Coriobacteriia bacterium]|jgi:putative ABC transport system permease protein